MASFTPMDPEKAVWGRGKDTSTAGPVDTGKLGPTLHDVTRPVPTASVSPVPSLEDGRGREERRGQRSKVKWSAQQVGPLFRRAFFCGGVL